MAITSTGSIFKALEFDGVSSRDFGVYITGAAVYNAPERDVEMISIPGRNGTFALDNGRFENIEVSYPAGIYADNEEDFRDAISEFRNFLSSRNGYVRLQDEYNPDEYRMAVYKSGIEVSPSKLQAGEFNIIFDCKPQRWLTSGESEETIASGNTLTNPTRFESNPLLKIEGYGDITFNDFSITLINETFGSLPFSNNSTLLQTVYKFDGEFNIGDAISFSEGYASFRLRRDRNNPMANYILIENVQRTGIISDSSLTLSTFNSLHTTEQAFVVGTPTTLSGSVSCDVYYSDIIGSFTMSLFIDYDGQNTITETIQLLYSTDVLREVFLFDGMPYESNIFLRFLTGISTASILGTPTYIDCDLGEAYKIENDEYISLNRFIDLGSKLPTIASGENLFEFDNTITSLKVVPRWWKV